MADGAWREAGVWVGLAALLLSACAQPVEPRPEEQPDSPPMGLEYVPPAPGTYDLPPIQPAADGDVLDADGSARRLFDYMGDKYVLLSLVYSRCSAPRGCPLATATLRRIEQQLESESELADRTRLVTLSFDPRHDTPETMLRYADPDYVTRRWDDRPWTFLTTASPSDLQPILDGYGQYVVREVDERGTFTGTLTHVLKVFLIDRQLRVRNIYSSNYIHAALAINDLKTLMLEDAAPS